MFVPDYITRSIRLRFAPGTVVLCLVGLLASNAFAASFHERAESLYEKRKFNGAVIELKNSLQEDPQNLPSRILLGRLYLDIGLAGAAEEQLLFAQRHGADNSLIVELLAKAWYAQKKYGAILNQLNPAEHGAEIAAALHIFRAKTYMTTGELGKAEQEFSQAQRYAPMQLEATLGQIDVLISRRDLPGAERLAHTATLGTSDARPWYVLGEIRRARGQMTTALEAYDRAIEIDSLQLNARIARAVAMMDTGELDKAEQDIDFVLRILPDDAKAHFLKAMWYSKTGNTDGYKSEIAKTADAFSDIPAEQIREHPTELLIFATIASLQGRYEEATSSLHRYLRLVPRNVQARKLLAKLSIAQGQLETAIDVLQPALVLAQEDAEVYLLLGRAYTANKEHSKATAVYEQAVKYIPDNVAIQTLVARSKLASGKEKEAIESLRQVVAKSGPASEAANILIQLYLRRNEFSEALDLARAMSDLSPRSAPAQNLVGSAYMGLGDIKSARARFEQALKLDPKLPDARLNLAKTLTFAGERAKARAMYDELVAEHPEDPRPLQELAKLDFFEGNLDSAIDTLVRVRTLAPKRSSMAQLQLIDLYVRTNRLDDAHRAALELEAVEPENLQALNAVADTASKLGQQSVATKTLNRMSLIAGSDPLRLHQAALYQIAAGEYDTAHASLIKASRIDNDYLPVQISLAKILAQRGDFEGALRRARGVAEKNPETSFGNELVGDLLMQQGQIANAMEEYQAGQAKEPTSNLAIRLFEANAALGNAESGISGLEAWANGHPSDWLTQRRLGAAYIELGRLDDALRVHQALQRNFPNDADILNNLATLHHQMGKPGALELAEKARTARPQDPAILDTLGWLLVLDGQTERGLGLLRESYARAATVPEVRYHLAVALSRLGRTSEARRELQNLLDSKAKFDGLDDARKLYEQLQQG